MKKLAQMPLRPLWLYGLIALLFTLPPHFVPPYVLAMSGPVFSAGLYAFTAYTPLAVFFLLCFFRFPTLPLAHWGSLLAGGAGLVYAVVYLRDAIVLAGQFQAMTALLDGGGLTMLQLLGLLSDSHGGVGDLSHLFLALSTAGQALFCAAFLGSSTDKLARLALVARAIECARLLGAALAGRTVLRQVLTSPLGSLFAVFSALTLGLLFLSLFQSSPWPDSASES